MGFLKQYQTSPALVLHREYNVMTGGRSDVNRWKEITKKYTVEEGLRVIRFVGKTYNYFPQMTMTKFKELLKEANADPLASQVPVSQEAEALANGLEDRGLGIHAEYVQDALTKYRDLLDIIHDECLELWYRMPTGAMFINKWYGEIRRGRTGNLTFSHRDKRFRQEFIAAPARVECQLSDAKIWEILHGIDKQFEG